MCPNTFGATPEIPASDPYTNSITIAEYAALNCKHGALLLSTVKLWVPTSPQLFKPFIGLWISMYGYPYMAVLRSSSDVIYVSQVADLPMGTMTGSKHQASIFCCCERYREHTMLGEHVVGEHVDGNRKGPRKASRAARTLAPHAARNATAGAAHFSLAKLYMTDGNVQAVFRIFLPMVVIRNIQAP
jgi:hypothetical protein